MSFPKSALLSEFGWEPMNAFMELKHSECVEWKYVNYMKNIFQSIGLDHYYYGHF